MIVESGTGAAERRYDWYPGVHKRIYYYVSRPCLMLSSSCHPCSLSLLSAQRYDYKRRGQCATFI
jgi:hypothetical protein